MLPALVFIDFPFDREQLVQHIFQLQQGYCKMSNLFHNDQNANGNDALATAILQCQAKIQNIRQGRYFDAKLKYQTSGRAETLMPS